MLVYWRVPSGVCQWRIPPAIGTWENDVPCRKKPWGYLSYHSWGEPPSTHFENYPTYNPYTSTVLKSHQAGKVTSSPWHGGDTEKSHQVVESHIREEESPWHSLFHLSWCICLKVAEALRTTGKMADTLLKRFIFIKNPIGIVGNQLIPISPPQIEILTIWYTFS